MMMMISLMMSLNLLTKLMNYKMNSLIIINLTFMMNILLINNFTPLLWKKINYIFGMDSISFMLTILTIWIMNLSLLSNNNFLMKKNNLMFLTLMILLMNIIYLCFNSMNLIIFFIFFEFSLIPMMLIIMGWGYQIDRIQASMYMLFYTLFGSLPLLISIMFLYFKMNSIMMFMLNMNNSNICNMYLYVAIILGFLIKMPMFTLHSWLPKAHVEAPISGSMILAGIMLKLGSYGMYRMMIIFPYMFYLMNKFLIFFSLMGGLICSIMCLNQTDLKITVAYSSIVHMSSLMASMMIMNYMSMMGSLMMMIAHGLCSPGMFFLVNLNYKQLHSRNILINKGMINIMPSLTLLWFLIFSSNFSAPPSLNLISEIFLINTLVQWNNYMMMMIFLISFFSTCYSIFIFAFTQYGSMNKIFNFKNININEFFNLLLLWTPLNIMFFNLNFLF